LRHAKVVSIKLDPNVVPAPLCSRKIGRAGTHEGIKNRVAYEAKHTNQPNGKGKRVRRRMVFGRFPSDVVPDLLDPFFVIGVGDNTQQASSLSWFSVTAGLSQHQDVLDIVLDDTVGIIWFAENATVPGDLIGGIGDLVPDYGSQVGVAQTPAPFLDG
jgi:hypothetical protein